MQHCFRQTNARGALCLARVALLLPWCESSRLWPTTDQPPSWTQQPTHTRFVDVRYWLAESSDFTHDWAYQPGSKPAADPDSRSPQLFSLLPRPSRITREGLHSEQCLATDQSLQQDPSALEATVLERYVVDDFEQRLGRAYHNMQRFALASLAMYKPNSHGLYWTSGTQLFVPVGEDVCETTHIDNLRKDCIEAVHALPTPGHYGVHRTLHKLQEVFY
jgi:hypothetical protein